MAKSKAVYFGAIWTEDKDVPTGSLDVEKLGELLRLAEDGDEDRIYFSVFENDDKEGNQPDLNLVFYPNEDGGKKSRSKKKYGGNRGGGKSKKSAGKKRSYGNSKKSSMF